jgi:glycosyltransferase involved in cell wall biosynthesis
MKVSVIMAVYNGERYLKEAIDSILSQTFSNFELLIVNDGSTDKTEDILKEFGDPRIRIFSQSNKGCIAARHLAIKNARGKYLAIMDSDDIALQERLSKTAAYLDSHNDVVLVGTAYITRNELTGTDRIDIPPTEDHVLKRCLLRYDPFKDPTNLIRADAFKKAGGYKIDRGFDYELYSRLARFGKLANIGEVLLITRQHADQFFRMGHTPEEHRKRRLKIQWLTLWRLKPPLYLFARTLLWLCFEFIVHLFPEKLRHHILPDNFRDFFKKKLPPNV